MDIFNPNHYIPRIFLAEKPNSPILIDEKLFLLSRKDIFKTIDNIEIFNTKDDYQLTKTYKEKNMFIVSSEIKHIVHYIDNGILILENISLNRSNSVQHIHVTGDCELYILTHNLSNQLSHMLMHISLEKGANLKVFSINSEKKQKSKYSTNYSLSNESQLNCNTLSIIQEEQYQDDSIQVIHGVNSSSKINYRSLTKGFTVSQVNSIIPEKATHSATEQHLKHTMLTDKAKIFSKPNLEISNSDVTASHGNSIGAIEKEHLFYLEQRGITENNAILLLLKSEINNFISQTSLEEELRTYIHRKDFI